MGLIYSLYYKGDLIAQFVYASDLDKFLDFHAVSSKLLDFTVLATHPEEKKIPKTITIRRERISDLVTK